MPLTGNPVDDVLIRNFNRLHYGALDGVYRPNATKARKRSDESLSDYAKSLSFVPYVYKTSPR